MINREADVANRQVSSRLIGKLQAPDGSLSRSCPRRSELAGWSGHLGWVWMGGPIFAGGAFWIAGGGFAAGIGVPAEFEGVRRLSR